MQGSREAKGFIKVSSGISTISDIFRRRTDISFLKILTAWEAARSSIFASVHCYPAIMLLGVNE
jgi:hypothetical protein